MKPVLPIDRGYVRVEWMQQTSFLFILQDFPQRPSATSGRTQRESRRRHYYAREDSDEEEAGPGSIQRDDRGGTWWRVTELMTVADSKLCLSALWKRSSQIKLSRQMLRSIRPKTIDTNELCDDAHGSLAMKLSAAMWVTHELAVSVLWVYCICLKSASSTPTWLLTLWKQVVDGKLGSVQFLTWQGPSNHTKMPNCTRPITFGPISEYYFTLFFLTSLQLWG